MPDPVVAHRCERHRRPRARTATPTSPPSGLNFTALWTRLTNTWPSRASSPRIVRQAGRDIDGDGDALALGEQPQPLRRASASRPRSTSSSSRSWRAALDPREVQQLVDHLDEVARLHLDLRDPLAHPLRDVGALGVAGERLGEQADGRQRRPQLVAQVVDELGPDLLEAAELGDVLEDDDQTRPPAVASRSHEEQPRLAVAGPQVGRRRGRRRRGRRGRARSARRGTSR